MTVRTQVNESNVKLWSTNEIERTKRWLTKHFQVCETHLEMKTKEKVTWMALVKNWV
jgi:hypothetical protein